MASNVKEKKTAEKPETAKKKTSSSRKKTTVSNHTQQKKNQPAVTMRDEIILWLVLALSIVIFISNLGFGGVVGNAISMVLFGIFGFPSYLLPFVIFFASAFVLSNKGNKVAWIKAGAVFVLWICFCALSELITNGYVTGTKITGYFTASAEYKSGGGVLGGLVGKMLCAGVGVIGAYAVIFILAIIGIVLVTERSLFAGMKNSGSRVYHSARQDADYHRQKAAIRKERRIIERQKRLERERAQRLERERTQLLKQQEELERLKRESRMDRKVSGVSMDTLIRPMEEYTGSETSAPGTEGDTKQAPDVFTIQRTPVPEEEIIEIIHDTDPTREETYLIHQEDPEEEFIEVPLSEAEDFMSIPSDIQSEIQPDMVSEVQPENQSENHSDMHSERQKKNPRSSKKEQEAGVQAVAREMEDAAKELPPEYVFPPIDLLKKPHRKRQGDSDQELRNTAAKLQKTLHDFGVEVNVTNVSCGPSVTRYELTPKQGVKVSRIVNLADDIKLNLAAADIRIEAPIPGKSAVGIEVPNKENSPVMLRELLESPEFKNHPSNLAFAAGKDIAGKVVVTDIAKMPHLLIAGATGSGKSVCINTIIMSILYKAKPEDVKLIMIDPKVVELSVYNGIPHLFIPVVTDPKKAAGALNWGVAEMTERYKKFADLNVRDLKGYNEKIDSIRDIEEEGKPEKLPQIVIIVDELADLMMVAPGEVEDSICRLAQLARAAGIHLIIATQRPSVNVITGLIKANMPSRIAFAVSSGVDSRTIIDMNGAEKLLGKGDMLFYPQGYQKPARVQGAFVSDGEVGDVVEFLSGKNSSSETYDHKVEEQITKAQQMAEAAAGGGEVDLHFAEAGKFIIEKDKASIGMLQRVFKIGFNRAARIMDQLSDAGVVGPEEGTKPRKVLMTMEEFERYLEECV